MYILGKLYYGKNGPFYDALKENRCFFQTRGEEFPYSIQGGKAVVGVWGLFTKGLGKNI